MGGNLAPVGARPTRRAATRPRSAWRTISKCRAEEERRSSLTARPSPLEAAIVEDRPRLALGVRVDGDGSRHFGHEHAGDVDGHADRELRWQRAVGQLVLEALHDGEPSVRGAAGGVLVRVQAEGGDYPPDAELLDPTSEALDPLDELDEDPRGGGERQGRIADDLRTQERDAPPIPAHGSLESGRSGPRALS